MKRNTLTTIIIFVLLFAVIGGMAFCIVKITSNETTKSVTALNFRVGGIDEEGDFDKELKTCLVTRDFLALEGLSIELPDGSSVQYKVFYYTKKGKFVSADESFSSGTYAPESTPEGATQVKIVIDPTDKEDLSFTDIFTYAKQITIKVAK